MARKRLVWLIITIILHVLQGSSQNKLRTRNHTPSHPTVILIAAIGTRVNITTAEERIVGVVTTVGRRRPIVAVRTTIVNRRTINVARVDKILRIRT